MYLLTCRHLHGSTIQTQIDFVDSGSRPILGATRNVLGDKQLTNASEYQFQSVVNAIWKYILVEASFIFAHTRIWTDWTKPGQPETETFLKAGYSKAYEPWQVVVGTGGEEVNGEVVRRKVEGLRAREGLRVKVLGLGFLMSVVGLWGDGA